MILRSLHSPTYRENSATEVHAALQPLRKLAEGRAVVCVHHLRKSDGGEGTAARGSGALVGFVDVVVELRRAPKATDPHGRRRMLKGYGRMSGIPDELLVEMDENGSTFHHIDTEASVVETRTVQEEGRKDALREAILVVLGDAANPLTRDDIWSRLPDGVKVNETRFRTLLETEAGSHWAKSGTGARSKPFLYRRIELVTHPGEEQGGEE